MNTLVETVIQGRPDNIKELPTDVLAFWSLRDELAVEDGIIFKEKQVLIPDSLRPDILTQPPQSHQGIQRTQLLATEDSLRPDIPTQLHQSHEGIRKTQLLATEGVY